MNDHRLAAAPTSRAGRGGVVPQSSLEDKLRSCLPAPVRAPLRAFRSRIRMRLYGAPRPSLLMWYRGDPKPVAQPLSAGLEWRLFSPGDARGWLALLNANGELGRWNESRLQGQIATLVPGTQRFVAECGRLVAGAGIYARMVGGVPAWEVGWVVRDPEYRGQGLGTHIVRAAVMDALALPPRPIFLFTDDHRTAGIRLYLELGFEPDIDWEPGAGHRWRRVESNLTKYATTPGAEA